MSFSSIGVLIFLRQVQDFSFIRFCGGNTELLILLLSHVCGSIPYDICCVIRTRTQTYVAVVATPSFNNCILYMLYYC